MKWNLDDLESKLNSASKELKKCDENLKKCTENIYYKDETNESVNTLKDILGEESEYIIANKKYKKWTFGIPEGPSSLESWTVRNSFLSSEFPKFPLLAQKFKKIR